MNEKEILDRMEVVYQYMLDNAGEPYYYDDLKKMVLTINQDLIDEKIVGLTRFQKIHLLNWICNLVNACEFALVIYEDPKMHDERRVMLDEMIDDLLEQSRKNFNLLKNAREK